MRLNNVVIAARDYEPMREFYKTLTEWPVFFESKTCCFLGRSRPYIVIHRVGPDTEVTPPENAICLDFEVVDLESEAARLRSRGIEVEIRPDMAVIRDPAGNLIELVLAE
jgi:catechol 2,3-dioxygenase-like lactoylglutathione lyase family enzyme